MMRRFPFVGTAMVALATCLVAVPARADVKAGVDAWEKGDYRKAIEEWRAPAVAGDADAQFNLAQAYKLGRGVPLDPGLAESWFRKAAAQGHVQAADNYGLALFQSGKRAEAVPWLEKSVARGEARAQLVLGTMLFNGDGVARNYPRAYALMTLASQAGLQSASETLAQMDQYITPADRQQGTRLMQEYSARLATAPRPTAPATNSMTTGGVRAIQPVPVPPSRPTTSGYGASYAVPGAPAEAASDPVRAAPPPPRPAPKAAPKASANSGTVHATPHSTPRPGGAWRIQLGAFRDRGNADILWQRVRGRLAGAQPFYVSAGGVTRLQAGGYASRVEAQAACGRSGQPCVVVAP